MNSHFNSSEYGAMLFFRKALKNSWVILLITYSFNVNSQSSFTPRKFIGMEGVLPYQVLMPKNFAKDKKYPLVLFLHGAGERGSDNHKQLVHGSKLFLEEENRTNYPAIVVFPQCAEADSWSNVEVKNGPFEKEFIFKEGGNPTKSMSLLLQLVDSLYAQKFIDQERMYVGGLSMGGMGTFELIARKPDVFTAAFPICGGGHPANAKKYAEKVNLWVFHGAKDDVVFPGYSVEMVLALSQAGARPKFNLYKEANHNSWDSTFAEPQLLLWLFSQSKHN